MPSNNVIPMQSQVRRVTGSANIDLSPQGRKQLGQMDYSEKFDHVFSGPEQRCIETAERFGDPIILKGLDAWKRGAYEGRPADQVKAQARFLMTHPDNKPPGVSPVSGQAGETYNELLKPLGHVMRAIKEHSKPNERTLSVTSGGVLQVIDHLAPLGFPATLDKKEYAILAQKPYWSATGQLFLLTEKGLNKVADNQAFGNYFIEHAATAFNPPQKTLPASA
jgi:broad specificity phosphatase PhoE